jgi:hypothetical protein
MSGLTFILAVVVTAVALIWLRTSGPTRVCVAGAARCG